MGMVSAGTVPAVDWLQRTRGGVASNLCIFLAAILLKKIGPSGTRYLLCLVLTLVGSTIFSSVSDVLVSEIQIVLVFTAAFIVSSLAPLAMTPLQRFRGLRDPGVTLYADDGGELHDHLLRPGVVPPLSSPL